MFENKKLLFLAPHTDDVELGCGSTIARAIEEGGHVFIAAFSTARQSLPKDVPEDQLRSEFIDAMGLYGIPEGRYFIYDFMVRKLSYHRQEILEELVVLKGAINPDWVFLPSRNDLHQDHQVLYNEGLRAFRDITVWGYELPWNHISFDAQGFIKNKRRHLEKKWHVMQVYKSQIAKQRQYFSWEFISGLAKMRGLQIKTEYAEAFEVYRIKI